MARLRLSMTGPTYAPGRTHRSGRRQPRHRSTQRSLIRANGRRSGTHGKRRAMAAKRCGGIYVDRPLGDNRSSVGHLEAGADSDSGLVEPAATTGTANAATTVAASTSATVSGSFVPKIASTPIGTQRVCEFAIKPASPSTTPQPRAELPSTPLARRAQSRGPTRQLTGSLGVGTT